MTAQKFEQNIAEGDLFFLARNHVGDRCHSDPRTVGQPFFQGDSSPGTGDHVLTGVDYQCGSSDVLQVGTNIMYLAGLNESKVGGDSTGQAAPNPSRTQ